MGEAKFTPGPWIAGPPATGMNPNEYRYVHAGGELVARVCAGYAPDRRLADQMEANARLIAAAPELLAALVEARAWIPTGERNSTPEKRGAKCDFASDVDALIEAAIRKATEVQDA